MNVNLNDEDQCFCADCCSQGHCPCPECNEPCTCESLDPTCDVCGTPSEDATEWCGNCGNCKEHCANFEGCDEHVCSKCGYPLINDPDVVIEYGPQCGDCGGPAKTIT